MKCIQFQHPHENKPLIVRISNEDAERLVDGSKYHARYVSKMSWRRFKQDNPTLEVNLKTLGCDLNTKPYIHQSGAIYWPSVKS